MLNSHRTIDKYIYSTSYEVGYVKNARNEVIVHMIILLLKELCLGPTLLFRGNFCC